jgi:hypothetical protein
LRGIHRLADSSFFNLLSFNKFGRKVYKINEGYNDLCGPMERTSPNFVRFINNYSGRRFIYFIKYQSEAASKFMKLINVIRNKPAFLSAH